MIQHSKTTLSKNDFNAVNSVMKCGMLTAGKIVDEFQNNFKEYVQKEYIQMYSSGSQGLFELLFALNIKTGDEVLIPSYICSSVNNVILKVGGTPVYYDNKKGSWTSSYNEIAKSINLNTKLIIINHTFGIQYNYEEIARIANSNIPLIEDCAHFISSNNDDIKISNLFLASFYSFNATKLMTTGEGGAICTNRKDIYLELSKYKLDSGISDINASLGISQLKQFDYFIKKRKEIANYYFDELDEIALELRNYNSIYFRFPIFISKQTKFLNNNTIFFRKGIDKLLHKNMKLPNVEKIFKETISIPIYPNLSKNEQKIIIEIVKELYYAN